MGPSWYSIWNGNLLTSEIPCHLLAELLYLQKSDERAGKSIHHFLWTLLTSIFSLSRISLAYGSPKNRKNIGSMTEKGFCLALVLDSTYSYGFPYWVSLYMELLKHRRRTSSRKLPIRLQHQLRVKALQQASKSGGTSTSS